MYLHEAAQLVRIETANPSLLQSLGKGVNYSSRAGKTPFDGSISVLFMLFIVLPVDSTAVA